MAYEYYQIFCYDFANIKSIKQARKSLANLINILWNTNVPELIKVADSYQKHFQYILNSFKTVKGIRITNGPIEGTNKIAKDLRRISAGYVNKERFIKRLSLIINRNK